MTSSVCACCRRLLYLAASFAILATAFVTLPAEAATAINQFKVASYLDQPVTSEGQTFFSATFYVDRTGGNVVVAGSSDGTASFYVDDLLKVDVTHPDGTVAGTTIDDSNGCTASTVLTTPPTNIARYLQYGINKIHVTFSDACGGDYGNSDIWVIGTATFPSADATLPDIDGGTRLAVFNTNPALKNSKGHAPGESCTSAFGVSAFGDLSYELTAKHCFDQEQGDQSTNNFIPSNMPVDVDTRDSKYTFSQELSCLLGASACLLPMNGAKPSADVVAFRPDTAHVTANVQTGSGLFPVLGETTLQALPTGTQICHYGTGSYEKTGNAEQCGKSQGYTTASNPGQGVPAGLGMFSARGFGGDSGGPVYVYSRNAANRIVGVYALGVVIIASNTGGTIFIPIRNVEANLAVRLLTAPPLS